MGSLFQLRDYWYTSFPGEEFSPSALTIGDIDNTNTADLIALGSFQGRLRIMRPGTERGKMPAEDLLLEKQFDEPILQLQCGPFEPVVEGVTQNLLAILFPRRLMLARLLRHGKEETPGSSKKNKSAGEPEGEANITTTGISTFYELLTYYETTFEHTTYNFTSGRFGHVSYHLICVQSMDGQLTIVDHNKVLYKRFLPSNQYLVPGCLAYTEKRDALLTNNSSMFLMCYSVSSIASSAGTDPTNPRQNTSSSTASALSPAWAFNLGDEAVDIQVARVSRLSEYQDADIIVLCPYTLYLLSHTGVCRLSKRLDVESAALGVYPLSNINAFNLLVCTWNGTIGVYSDSALEWSAALAQGTGNALTVRVGTLCGVQGMLATLSTEGTLSVNYLGTDPADGPVQPLDTQVAAYSDMVMELRQLQREVAAAERGGCTPQPSLYAAAAAAHQNNDPEQQVPKLDSDAIDVAPGAVAAAGMSNSAQAPAPAPSDEILPSTTTGPESRIGLFVESAKTAESLVCMVFASVPEAPSADGSIVLLLQVTLQPQTDGTSCLSDVAIQVQSTAPVEIEPPLTTIPSLTAGSTVTVSFRATCSTVDGAALIPSSLEVIAVAMYPRGRHAQCTSQTHTILPLALVGHAIAPVKSTAFSVQVNTDKVDPPSLQELYSEFSGTGYVATNVLSVEYCNGVDATILVSKNAARFKLQGSTPQGLWLLATDLLRRLRDHYHDPALSFEVAGEVPLRIFEGSIETHMVARRQLVSAHADLDQAAEFFRAVEKRLLARFRDRNPVNTDAIELLLNESYKLLFQRTEAVAQAKASQRRACAALNACAGLFFLSLRSQYASLLGSAQEWEVVRVLLSCPVEDDITVGWEEMVEAALAHLLRMESRHTASKVLEVSHNTGTVKMQLRKLVDLAKSGKRIETFIGSQ